MSIFLFKKNVMEIIIILIHIPFQGANILNLNVF